MKALGTRKRKKKKKKEDLSECLSGWFWYAAEDKYAILGLTQAGLDQFGEISHVSFPEDGDYFSEGEVFLRLEGELQDFALASLGEMQIVDINREWLRDPSLMSEDPLEQGWLLKMEFESEMELARFFEMAKDSEESIEGKQAV